MSTIIFAAIGYFFLLLTVRVLSRRPGAQMTPFEFVIIFLIGGVIILATVGQDRSVTNCGLAILTIGMLHRGLSFLKSHFPKVGAVADGTPLVIVRDRHWVQETMERMRLHSDDVMAAARSKGMPSIFKVRYAILERNGAISIIKSDK